MQINTRSPVFFRFLGEGLLGGGTSEAESSELSEEAALVRFLAFLAAAERWAALFFRGI